MFNDVVQIAGTLAIIITLVFLGSQTRKLQRQIDLSNLFSRYEALNHSSERYDHALTLLLQWPHLRPYIYEEKPLDLEGADLDRALIIADVMAGAVDYAVRVGEIFPDNDRSAWGVVAEDMSRQPLFQKIVAAIPHHFPDLAPFFVNSSKVSRSVPDGQSTEA